MPELIERLQERARAARSEGTATALADAIHFEEAAKRIEELERACGAAALAMAADVLGSGVPLASLVDSSASRMCLEAVGVRLDQKYDLIRFRNEYMARFKPTPE